MEVHETFWTLIKDTAHWQFELFLILLFDGLIGALLWPCLKRFGRHHKSDDQKLAEVRADLQELRKQLGVPKE